MTERYYRKLIKIVAEDSPNVRLALAQIESGRKPTGEVILPGVLPWNDYVKRRETWDEIMQCIGLDAMFWAGGELLVFPPVWLAASAQAAINLDLTWGSSKNRVATAVGIDTAEGGDSSVWSAVDKLGLIDQVSYKTPNTNDVIGITKDFVGSVSCSWDMVCFDRGGGGKQHADRLRDQGYPVTTIGFGETVTPELRRGTKSIKERVSQIEERLQWFNRRAQMYGEAAQLMDPSREIIFAVHTKYTELRRQLSLIPKRLDSEGRLKLPPKRRTNKSPDKTLEELLGCSPDEGDSLVIAVHKMLHGNVRRKAGVPSAVFSSKRLPN